MKFLFRIRHVSNTGIIVDAVQSTVPIGSIDATVRAMNIEIELLGIDRHKCDREVVDYETKEVVWVAHRRNGKNLQES